jgi:penicillin-binding protein 1A
MKKLKIFNQSKKKTIDKNITNKKTLINKLAIVVSVFLVLAILASTTGIVYIGIVLSDAPNLNSSDFIKSDSSKLFDTDGNLITDVGYQIRENISYDEMPQVLIDAFISVEDSRFFEHNGFDIPRFTKAMFENLLSLSFSQGGSTFTMQLVKGTYFESEEATAVRSGLAGVNRKIKEIYVAIQAEKVLSKKRIIELYLNRINFGVPGNKRGIQTAAQYYFGKDVSEITLVEAAMLAGVINAPNAYNPLNNLELSQKRINTVLELMERHGYISNDELILAKSVKIENLIVGSSNSNSNNYPYQAFVDATIQEVKDLTGLDPVDIPMRIYTTMDRDTQETMEKIQNGEIVNVAWPNEIIQTAMITMNNSTGEILGIGGGRFYNGERLLNRATDMTRQPGSSVKTLFTYPLAFEHLGWSTQHMLEDKPIQYVGLDVIIKNFDGNYRGDILVPAAIGSSLNIPAIQTLQSVVDTIGTKKVVSYLNSVGFTDVTTDSFDIGYAIGGSSFEVSPLQLVGAQASIINGGNYIQPHTVVRIEFLDGKEPITPTYTSTSTISAEAAYMSASMMEQNVQGPYFNFMQLLKRDFSVYAKTGTSDWGNTGVEYGIPEGAAKDKWMLSATSEYTTAVWVGYDKAVSDQISYMNQSQINLNLPGKINNEILNSLYKDKANPVSIPRPKDVIDVTHIVGIYPYVSPNANTNPSLVVSGLIKSEYANLGTLPNPTILSPSTFNRTVTSNGNNRTYKFTINPYPDANALVIAPNTKDYYLEVAGKVVEGTGQRLFDYSWIYGPIVYKVKITVNGTEYKIKSNASTLETTINAKPEDTVTVCGYYGYDFVEVNSTELCKTDKMNELFLTVPNFIGETETTLSNWITTNGLTLSKFIITKIEAEDASQINQINKIIRIDPSDKHNITIEASNKDSLSFTAFIIKETKINLADFIGKTSINLPSSCDKYTGLCSLHSTSTSTGLITKVFIGTNEYTSGEVNLSEIFTDGIKYYIGPITTP